MFICLTNHQPKQIAPSSMGGSPFISEIMNILGNPPSPSSQYGSGGIISMEIPREAFPVKSARQAPVSPVKAPKQKKFIAPETPKDNDHIILNLLPEDVISLTTTRFGGTEMIYLCSQQSSNVPEAMGGNTMTQKATRVIYVKEPPAQVASMMGIKPMGL